MVSPSTPSPPPSTNGAVVDATKHDHADVSSSTTTSTTSLSPSTRPIILHLGDPIYYNPELDRRLRSQFTIIRPQPEDLPRQIFRRHLIDRTWGNFSAIMKPFWSSGSEMHDWDAELIGLLPQSMRVMAGAGAGFDWVDTKALSERGILYCNGAHASTESVANTALYHLISVFTHSTASSLAARSGVTSAFMHAHTQIPFISHNPADHTLGIVGLGLIGHAIAKKASVGLGMKILYTDLVRKSPQQEEEAGAAWAGSLEELLPKCDCVLLATPAGPPLLTARTLALLPHGARVVNIARGSLIDEDSLAAVLKSGHISAVGLDVHAKEPVVNAQFRACERVQLTCHTGGASVETNKGFERLVMENCEDVLNGGGGITPVNAQMIHKIRGEKEREEKENTRA